MSFSCFEDFYSSEAEKDYFKKLTASLDEEYSKYTVYPERENIFLAGRTTDFDDIKAVIIGQDPYHEPGQAHGLAFSVLPGAKLPPSLRNIYREIEDDLGIKMPDNGYLLPWAKRGVLLLNTVLTVREGEAGSHGKLGWQRFTDALIEEIAGIDRPIVFLLWGKHAWEKERFVTLKDHLVLKAAHPSPLSAYRGFFGCKHFSKTNEFLTEHGLEGIDWSL